MEGETAPAQGIPARAVALVPGLGALGVLVWWALKDGGYAATVWLPGLIVLLALGALAAFGRAAELRSLPRVAQVALGLLAAYVAWSALSILWAQDPGLALTGTLRAALYLAVAVLFAALPWREIDAVRVLIALVLGVTALGLVAMVRLASAAPGDLGDLLLQSRLAWPLGYQNANAALWTMAAVPAVVVASRRETFWLLRPVLLAASAVLLDLGLLSQSRGWLFTLPLIALATALLVPGRLRLLPWAMVAAGACAIAADPMLAVYRAGGEKMPASRLAGVAQAIDTASGRLAIAALVALVAGGLLVLADRRLSPSPRAVRRIGWGVAAAIVLAVAGGVAAGVAATHGDPGAKLSKAWSDFKDNRTESAGQGRFAAFGSSRYDFWRVGLNEFRAHPITGIGQDNFAEAYLLHRRNPSEEPRWTHSLELRLLVHTGLVGALLFLGFAGCLVAAAVGRARPRSWVPAALLLPATVWLLHGSVDWLWEFPALSGLALAPAGMALALGRRETVAPAGRLATRRALTGVGVAAGLAVAVLAGMTFVSERLLDRGMQRWTTDPAGAFDDLDRAAALQPLSGRPDLQAGMIALRVGDVPRARRLFARAADRDPHGWFIHLDAGLAASAAGDRGAAGRELRRSADLNPRERVTRLAIRRLHTRRPLTFDEAARVLAARVEQRFGAR